ncbi:MAG: hypothetical protein HQL79_07480 [Magnetococcales bacterium]|nr:hypothetical protein [Magnetococcales bacterium]
MKLLGSTIDHVANAIGAKLAPAIASVSRGLRMVLGGEIFSEEQKYQKLFAERTELMDKLKKVEGESGNRPGTETMLLSPIRKKIDEINAEMRKLQDSKIQQIQKESQEEEKTKRKPLLFAEDAATKSAVSDQESEVKRQRISSNQKLIETLRAEREELYMTDRERFISHASRRLSAAATSEQRSEVERLAGALFDEKKAIESQSRIQNDYQSELLETDGLLEQTAKDYDVLGDAADMAFKKTEEKSKEWSDGVKRAAQSYSDEVMDSSRNWETATSNAFRNMENALVQFVTTGKADFKGLVNSILADLTRITVRETITGPLAKALGMGMGGGSQQQSSGGGFDFLGSLFGGGGGGSSEGGGFDFGDSLLSSIFHDGGMVESGSTSRMVSASLFYGAPRFHSGGLIGPDEVPIIAQRGERVLSREETQAFAAGRKQGGGSKGVEIQIVNVTNPDMVKKLAMDAVTERKDTIVNMVLNAMDERNLMVRRI